MLAPLGTPAAPSQKNNAARHAYYQDIHYRLYQMVPVFHENRHALPDRKAVHLFYYRVTGVVVRENWALCPWRGEAADKNPASDRDRAA